MHNVRRTSAFVSVPLKLECNIFLYCSSGIYCAILCSHILLLLRWKLFVTYSSVEVFLHVNVDFLTALMLFFLAV